LLISPVRSLPIRRDHSRVHESADRSIVAIIDSLEQPAVTA
jgi:hypothetical protein